MSTYRKRSYFCSCRWIATCTQHRYMSKCWGAGWLLGSRFPGVHCDIRTSEWCSLVNQIRPPWPPGELEWWFIRVLTFSETSKLQSPRQQKNHRARKHFSSHSHGLLKGDRVKSKAAIEGEIGGKMRAPPPTSENFPTYWAFSGRTRPLQ